MNKFRILPITVLLVFAMYSCKSKQNNTTTDPSQYEQGSFGYDLEFFNTHQKSLILQRGNSIVLLAPDYQGRVMTSSANGLEGKSFGWMNYDLISSGENAPHFNNYGGEERFWLGPEGGQFSIFFKPGVAFTFENWQVPAPIDSEPFELIESNDTIARFKKDIQITNYSNFTFDLRVDRSVTILNRSQTEKIIGIALPEMTEFVAYSSTNTITNTGENAWSKSTGLLSVWMLGQLISSPNNTVIAPYNIGSEEELGSIVNDSYFGKVASERLSVLDSLILFKADGKQRGKIGLNPSRARNYIGSYDSAEKVLTVLFFNKPENNDAYVNSMWELQEKPFAGDVVNSYNDGPLEDGSQLGPFYELEASSPAALLKPNHSLTHINTTIHISGDESALNKLLIHLFGISIEKVKQALGQ